MRNRIRTALRHRGAVKPLRLRPAQPTGCRVARPDATSGGMKLQVRHAGGELTVGSHKEFLLLWQRGIVAADDLVRREGQEEWTPAGELPWIRGMRQETRRDNRRLFWITLAMMVLGLLGVVWIQSHSSVVARKTGALPSGSVRAVPAR